MSFVRSSAVSCAGAALLVTLAAGRALAADPAPPAAPAAPAAPVDAAPAPLAAAPAPPAPASSVVAEKKSVVVLDLEAVGVEPGQAALVSGLAVDALSKYDELSVLQKQDIQQMAAFEADKQALGCSETSCLAEIAGALGASYVVFGRVGTLDGLVLVQLNLFDASAGKPVARQDIRAGRLADIARQMPNAVGLLVQPLTGRAPPEVPALEEPGPSPLVLGLRWGGLATAGTALVAGGVTTGIAGIAAVIVLDEEKATAKDRNTWKAVGAGMVVTTAVAAVVVVLGAAAFGASYLGES